MDEDFSRGPVGHVRPNNLHIIKQVCKDNIIHTFPTFLF